MRKEQYTDISVRLRAREYAASPNTYAIDIKPADSGEQTVHVDKDEFERVERLLADRATEKEGRW